MIHMMSSAINCDISNGCDPLKYSLLVMATQTVIDNDFSYNTVFKPSFGLERFQNNLFHFVRMF